MMRSNDRQNVVTGWSALFARAWLIGMALLLSAGSLFAADGEAGAPGDFREKVMIAYGTVFAVVLGYLVLSHRKNAKVREKIELLEERIDELGS